MLTRKQIIKKLFLPNGNTHDFSPRGPKTPTEEPKAQKPPEADNSKQMQWPKPGSLKGVNVDTRSDETMTSSEEFFLSPWLSNDEDTKNES